MMAAHLHFRSRNAVVLTLIMLGKYLEARAKSGAAGALRALLAGFNPTPPIRKNA
jgi:Cu+-exporting ATPase